jgi:hypothetical protein
MFSDEAIVKVAGKRVCPRCVEIVTRAAEAERLQTEAEKRRQRQAQEDKEREAQARLAQLKASADHSERERQWQADLAAADTVNARALRDEDVRQFVKAAGVVVALVRVGAALLMIGAGLTLFTSLIFVFEAPRASAGVEAMVLVGGVAAAALLALLGFIQWNVAIWFTKFSLLFGRNVIANERRE